LKKYKKKTKMSLRNYLKLIFYFFRMFSEASAGATATGTSAASAEATTSAEAATTVETSASVITGTAVVVSSAESPKNKKNLFDFFCFPDELCFSLCAVNFIIFA
jgi:hypothetical protein